MLEALGSYPYPSFILIGSGLISMVMAKWHIDYEKTREKALDIFFQFFTFCWGITALIWGVITLGSSSNNLAAGALIIVGLSLFLKPLKNIPWGSLLSLIIAGSITALLAFRMETIIFFGIDLRWALVVVFFAILFFLYLIFKFLEDIFNLIGLILSNDPISLLIGMGGVGVGVFTLIIPY